MGKKLTTFAPGESETDEIVRRWLSRKGIDQNDVSGYSIFRHSGEPSRIMIEMFFDDSPGLAKLPIPEWCPHPPGCVGCPGREHQDQSLCSRETESAPEPSIVTMLRADHEQGRHDGAINAACPSCMTG